MPSAHNPANQPSNHPPVMHNFTFIVVMADLEPYRVGVTAQTRQDAAREIIHQQMAKGEHVRSIRDAE